MPEGFIGVGRGAVETMGGGLAEAIEPGSGNGAGVVAAAGVAEGSAGATIERVISGLFARCRMNHTPTTIPSTMAGSQVRRDFIGN